MSKDKFKTAAADKRNEAALRVFSASMLWHFVEGPLTFEMM